MCSRESNSKPFLAREMVAGLLIVFFSALANAQNDPNVPFEFYFPRVYSPIATQQQLPATSTAFYIPMCGHERLQNTIMQFTITYNVPDDTVQWVNAPLAVYVYFDSAGTQPFTNNANIPPPPGPPGNAYKQSWTVPYPSAQRPLALYMVAITSGNGWSSTSPTTQWNFAITFLRVVQQPVGGVVNLPPPPRPPAPAYMTYGGNSVPLQLVQQFVMPVGGVIQTYPYGGKDHGGAGWRYVTSVCQTPLTYMYENFIQVTDSYSRVELYICYGNGTSNFTEAALAGGGIVTGWGCTKNGAVLGRRQATAGGWSRILMPLNATLPEEIHGVVYGFGQFWQLQGFQLFFRLGPNNYPSLGGPNF